MALQCQTCAPIEAFCAQTFGYSSSLYSLPWLNERPSHNEYQVAKRLSTAEIKPVKGLQQQTVQALLTRSHATLS